MMVDYLVDLFAGWTCIEHACVRSILQSRCAIHVVYIACHRPTHRDRGPLKLTAVSRKQLLDNLQCRRL
jgi:hypothetical protein